MIRIKQHLFYGPKVQYNSGHDLELERMAALIIKEVFARSTPVIFCKVLSKKAFGNIIVDIAAKVALASYEAITVVPARGCLEMKIEDMLEPITDLRTIIDQIRKSKSQNPH